MKTKKTILIDLDGVLNEYNGKFDPSYIPPIKQGAKEFVAKLADIFVLKLFTTRSISLATKWLQEYEIDSYFVDVTNLKEPCFAFIDDRCIKFDGDYNKTFEAAKNFIVWWRNI